jgi:hypothetical protein
LTVEATQPGAILFSEMTPGPSWEDEFNDWYDREHIPLRMAVPGFASAQRYRIPGALNYLAVYEMDSAEVLKSEAYIRLKNHPSERTAQMLRGVTGFTRYIGEQISVGGGSAPDAPQLYVVFFEVPADRERAFSDWHEQEHTPLLLQCPQWLMVRRFRLIGGEPKTWTHLALHYLSDRQALVSGEHERARASEWRAKLAAESWFTPHNLVFDRFGPRQVGAREETPN